MADLKLKYFASHGQSPHSQAADCDNGELHSTNNDFISPNKPENTQRSALSVSKGLRVGQAGMIWEHDGTLLGKVQHYSPTNPEELEGYPLNEKGEVLDDDGQKIGQALAHETFAGTRFRSARKHSFYKIKPDESGQYHCPYAALEVCLYRPQKLKSNFE